MNHHRNASISKLLLAALAAGAIIVAVIMLRPTTVSVIPDPPRSPAAGAVKMDATTSHLSVALNFPKAVITAELEGAIPKTFKFDESRDGARAYGSPSRAPLNVAIDPAAKRISASTSVGGRVQVEKRVKIRVLFVNIDELASVGIDVSGSVGASASPLIGKDWVINPQLDISAKLNKAVASVPIIGGIDITGHLQGPIGGILNGAKPEIDKKLKESLDVRKEVERLWNEISSVHRISESPPVWLRITPQKVTFPGFQYTSEAIDSGLTLDLETHVFIQDAAPEVVKSTLPELTVGGPISDDFELSVPIEVSYAVLNQQLGAQLPKQPVKLPANASVSIKSAEIKPYGDGILLAVEFEAKRGRISASGRLYIVGVPLFDAEKSELRVEQLEFSAETKSLLLKVADWLAHADILAAMQNAAVFKLDTELTKAKDQANKELDQLKTNLPKEVGANVKVTDLVVERLAFTQDRTFAVIKARGKMSARLK